MSPSYVPDRGHIIWLDFNPRVGHEQANTRPALVISPAQFNGAGNYAFVCPITSRIRGWLFEVPLPPGLPTKGVVLANQLKSQDWRARHARFIETASTDVVECVLDFVIPILQMG